MQLTNASIFMLLFFMVVFISLYFYHLKTKKEAQQRYLQGLSWLKAFRTLLTAIQQHRGLTMGYLSGDHSLLPRANVLKADINQQLATINKNKNWIENNQVWNGINDHWIRLSINYTKYEKDHNFRQHCNLIVNLLNLIEDCADNHHLQELVVNKKENANFLWSQLLVTAEHVGQVRAIGTSIAAAQISSSTQRIKINYLQNCINVFLQKQTHSFDTKLLSELINTINKNLMGGAVDISAEAFFNLSTSALDELLEEFDIHVQNLQMGIEQR